MVNWIRDVAGIEATKDILEQFRRWSRMYATCPDKLASIQAWDANEIERYALKFPLVRLHTVCPCPF